MGARCEHGGGREPLLCLVGGMSQRRRKWATAGKMGAPRGTEGGLRGTAAGCGEPLIPRAGLQRVSLHL